MTDAIPWILTVIALGHSALLLMVCLLTFCICSIAYTIWIDRQMAMGRSLPFWHKQATEPPEYQNYRYYRDEEGKVKLMPAEEAEQLQRNDFEDEDDPLEMEDVENWIDGKLQDFVYNGRKPSQTPSRK